MNILKSRFSPETFALYIHRRLSLFLKLSLLIGALLMFFQGRYQAMVEILIILFVTFLPLILGKRFDVQIPHGFETLAVFFFICHSFWANRKVTIPGFGGGTWCYIVAQLFF